MCNITSKDSIDINNKHISLQAGMERAGRSQSLVDLHGSGEVTSGTPTSGTPVIHQSLMDLRPKTLQTGEILLNAGSPASPGCSTECDPTLLDNDSDSN
jgi:hypothetical protein